MHVCTLNKVYLFESEHVYMLLRKCRHMNICMHLVVCIYSRQNMYMCISMRRYMHFDIQRCLYVHLLVPKYLFAEKVRTCVCEPQRVHAWFCNNLYVPFSMYFSKRVCMHMDLNISEWIRMRVRIKLFLMYICAHKCAFNVRHMLYSSLNQVMCT